MTAYPVFKTPLGIRLAALAALLDENGKAQEDFSASNVENANPRSVLGYFEPGHYCFVQVDGRGSRSKLEKGKTSRGMELTVLAEFMENLGCKAAYTWMADNQPCWYTGMK